MQGGREQQRLVHIRGAKALSHGRILTPYTLWKSCYVWCFCRIYSRQTPRDSVFSIGVAAPGSHPRSESTFPWPHLNPKTPSGKVVMFGASAESIPDRLLETQYSPVVKPSFPSDKLLPWVSVTQCEPASHYQYWVFRGLSSP